ncbi:MAG: complex I NDUFA9 subunit family protein [Sphingobium sp.]|nr:complex I NDUFA9 subunit family protein [Sphingobium sp.]
MLVTLLGGGGFVGRYVAQELLARGMRVRIAQRNPGIALRVKPLGGLGQTQLMHADVRDAASIARAVAGADAVVNLVSVLDGKLDATNHQGAATVAQAAAQAGVRALVQISALGADSGSPSAYGRSKGQGEDAVRAAFPAATIIRPSVIFGPDDQFTNRFASMARLMPVLPVLAPEAKFQPVYVVDVARAISDAVEHAAAHSGQVYELGGPQVLSMMEINRYVAQASGRKDTLLPVCNLGGSILAALPLTPITRDQWKMLRSDNVVQQGAKGFAEFGIEPTPLGAVAESWLISYRKHGRFSD